MTRHTFAEARRRTRVEPIRLGWWQFAIMVSLLAGILAVWVILAS